MNQYLFAARNLYDKFHKVVGNWETLRFYWQTYILSRLESVDPDVYVVSYPKCGRTWLRVMLQMYLEARGYTLRHYNDKLLLGIEGEALVKFDHDKGNWVPAPLRIDQLTFDTEKYTGKDVVFLVRDPRDVLVSSWYHLTYRERIYRGSLSAFVRDELIGIEKVVAYMNLWMEHRDVPANFLLLTYEEMHADPHVQFERLLGFIGIPVERDALNAAVEASSFENMKKMERTGALKEPWMKPGARDANKSLKVRKGKVGSFQEELTQDDIDYVNAVITGRLSPELPYHRP